MGWHKDRRLGASGFTLIELVVVIAIISVLAGVLVPVIATQAKKSRDSRRLADMRTIQKALDQAYLVDGEYPSPGDMYGHNDCGWAASTGADYMFSLVRRNLLEASPRDPLNRPGSGCHSSNVFNYKYYRYGSGGNGCPFNRGPHYVLGLETTETNIDQRGQFGKGVCGRDWASGGDMGGGGWVTGRFENPE